MKKINDDYLRVTLYLSPSSKTETDIYYFLNSLSRKKTYFIVNLITKFLIQNGIKSAGKLSKREIQDLLELSKDNNSNKTDDDSIKEKSLVNMLYQLFQQPQVQKNVETIQPQTNDEIVKPQVSNGRFQKKTVLEDSVLEEKEKDSDFEDEMVVQSEMKKDNTDETGLASNWKESLASFDNNDMFE